MARTAGKKQAPQKFEEPDDAEGWEDAVVDADDKEAEANLRLRDWRDVERFREMKELRSLVDDDYGLEEIFHIPLKPRAEPGIPVPRAAAKLVKGQPAKALAVPPAKAAPAKAPPAKPAAKPAPVPAAHAKGVSAKAAKTTAKAAPAPAKKPPAKLKAKVKRK
jgi:hypothetical protein